jgi:hypothetical protein
MYISMPMDIRDEMVRRIVVQLGDLDKMGVDEFDENGNLVPFGNGGLFSTIDVS